MSFLRNSLQAADTKMQEVKHANPSQKPKSMTGSDLNTLSQCPSTTGTKSGIDMPST